MAKITGEIKDKAALDRDRKRGTAAQDLERVSGINCDFLEESFVKRHSSKLNTERLNKAKVALRLTMDQANKIIEMIHYFRSFNLSAPKVHEFRSSVQEAVSQVLHAMSYEYSFKMITVVKMIPYDLPSISIAREHLDTILFQLINNARKSIGERSGIITIEARHEPLPFQIREEAPYFELRISDNGNAPQYENFEAMFDSTALTNESSEKLGLYMVKKLVDLNGGTLRMESTRGGTSFFVRFAYSKREEA